jgi:hypothetical protein
VGRALRYRLFGTGKMPPALAQAAADSRVLLAVEGVSVKQSVSSLRMRRASVSQGSKLLVGSLVLLSDRVLASVGDDQIVDAELRGEAKGGSTLTLAHDGVRMSIDVASLVDGASGSMELHYRLDLDATVLEALAARAASVELAEAAPALLRGWAGTWAR